MIRTLARALVPAGLRARLSRALGRTYDPTVSEGWDEYAREFRAPDGSRLGDEWSDPDVYGMEVPAAEVIPHLDREVFAPFLGHCDTLVEIGAGGGRLTEVLAPRCRRILAADTAPAMVALLRERFAGRPEVEPVLLDGKGLGFLPDDSVDAAFSFDVFVHLQPWDFYNYLAEIRRVLKPGGRAIVHHSNVASELGWQRFLWDVPHQLNRHKRAEAFSPMTPELARIFAERAGLGVAGQVTEVMRRDCITLLLRPPR